MHSLTTATPALEQGTPPTRPLEAKNHVVEEWFAEKCCVVKVSLSSMVNSKHTLLLLQHDKNQSILNVRNND